MARHDLDKLAAEYALGTLAVAERDRADELRARDPSFEAAVLAWEALLSPLGETTPPVKAPPSLRKRIESALPDRRFAGTVVQTEIAAQIVALRKSLETWRMAAAGAAVAALALALMWMGGVQPPGFPTPPQVRYVAVLQSDAGEAGFLVTMNMKDKQFVIHPVVTETPPAKSFELWALMKDNKKPPMTLGLVGTGAYAMMDAPAEIDDQELSKGVRLAISLEPEGGAPQGKSMGPVVFAGDLVREAH